MHHPRVITLSYYGYTYSKVLGITLITSTNMPLGRDGPMVHIGAPLQRNTNSSVHTRLSYPIVYLALFARLTVPSARPPICPRQARCAPRS
jgi:hypothetical protein